MLNSISGQSSQIIIIIKSQVIPSAPYHQVTTQLLFPVLGGSKSLFDEHTLRFTNYVLIV